MHHSTGVMDHSSELGIDLDRTLKTYLQQDSIIYVPHLEHEDDEKFTQLSCALK